MTTIAPNDSTHLPVARSEFARVMGGGAIPPAPVRGVTSLSTGRVTIHPQHVRGSRLPPLVWILLSPKWVIYARSVSSSSSTMTD